jgi:hypothetical protein
VKAKGGSDVSGPVEHAVSGHCGRFRALELGRVRDPVLWFLRLRVGAWGPLAKALRYESSLSTRSSWRTRVDIGGVKRGASAIVRSCPHVEMRRTL